MTLWQLDHLTDYSVLFGLDDSTSTSGSTPTGVSSDSSGTSENIDDDKENANKTEKYIYVGVGKWEHNWVSDWKDLLFVWLSCFPFAL